MDRTILIVSRNKITNFFVVVIIIIIYICVGYTLQIYTYIKEVVGET